MNYLLRPNTRTETVASEEPSAAEFITAQFRRRCAVLLLPDQIITNLCLSRHNMLSKNKSGSRHMHNAGVEY